MRPEPPSPRQPVLAGSASRHAITTCLALPEEHALQATVTALEEPGFSVEVAGDLDAARQAVLARIPEGSSVMTSTSVTLDQTGLADAINDGAGPPLNLLRPGRIPMSAASSPEAPKVQEGPNRRSFLARGAR